MLPIENGNLFQPMNMMGNVMPLSTLIEFIVQRTYHELLVLSELLPRKTDLERKIEISQFACRTKQLFVRLLALVKWTNSACKVEKCARIYSFLQQQQFLFIDTADSLARMARETLVHARLPSFSLPCAVDVLTTGTYPRLPYCIKEKIVPPEILTAIEKKQTLDRLTQIIEYRIVTSNLPLPISKPNIYSGRVKFLVKNEFQATLTLMSDNPTIPWRLLDIEILVEDPDFGGDGGVRNSLVHPLQLNYLHEIVQSRLLILENDNPLIDMYNCLHSFCQSLQLEVLHSQIIILIHQRYGDYLRIKEYIPGKSITVCYWRDLSKKEGKQENYKMTFAIEDKVYKSTIQITHLPQVIGLESIKIPQFIASNSLSFEKVLIQSIQVRSLIKLKQLEREFQLILSLKCDIKDTPSILFVPLLNGCCEFEFLCISVDLLKGSFVASMAHKTDMKTLVREVEECLNDDKKDLKKIFLKLKISLLMSRIKKALQSCNIHWKDSLMLSPENNKLEVLAGGGTNFFIELPSHNDYYLVIKLIEGTLKETPIMTNYYLIKTERIESSTNTLLPESELILDVNKLPFLKVTYFYQLNNKSIISRHDSKLPDSLKNLFEIEKNTNPASTETDSMPEILHVVAFADDMLSFINLSKELNDNSLTNTGYQQDGEGVGLSISLLKFPTCHKFQLHMPSINKCVLSMTIRLIKKEKKFWTIQIILRKSPLKTSSIHEKDKEQSLTLKYEKTTQQQFINSFLKDWSEVIHLYEAVLQFNTRFKDNISLQREIEVESYTFQYISFAYGPKKCFFAKVSYSITNECFKIDFGVNSQVYSCNCHSVAEVFFEKYLNNTKSLFLFIKLLRETYLFFMSLLKFNTSPIMWLKKSPIAPIQMFTIIIESPTYARIFYRSSFCLEVHCKENQTVVIRDGAYSINEAGLIIDGINPIKELQTFLNGFATDYQVQQQLHQQIKHQKNVEDELNDDPSRSGFDLMDTSFKASPGNGTISIKKKISLRSPTNSNILAPSPGSALHVPSPSSFIPAPSPAVPFIGVQDQNTNSPYGSLRNWSSSPNVPVLGQGITNKANLNQISSRSNVMERNSLSTSLKALIPSRTLNGNSMSVSMHFKAFSILATPINSGRLSCSPLERFLGSIFLRRHFQRVITSEETFIAMPVSEAGVTAFKADICGLHMKLMIIGSNLKLKIFPSQEGMNVLNSEDLEKMEKYFDSKIVCPPFKPNPLVSFCFLFKFRPLIIKDFVQIMHLEMNPDKNFKWIVQMLLTLPQGNSADLSMGGAAIGYMRKIMFMITLTYNHLYVAPNIGQDNSNSIITKNAQTQQNPIIIPLVYDPQTNHIQYDNQKLSSNLVNPSISMAVQSILKKFSDYTIKYNECSIFPAIKELIINLN